MKIKKEFDKSANSYSNYSKVQAIGAKLLVKEVGKDIGNIADIGCGSGRVYKNIRENSIYFNRFYGIDFSKEMLKLHPKEPNIELMVGDFNTISLFKKLEKLELDTIISSSALQWAKNLEWSLRECSKVANRGYFFIFTSKTFKSIHKIAKINSPIYPKESAIEAFTKSFKPNKIELLEYKLEFNNTLEMLRYIQKSGVSAGVNLSYKKMKKILDEYPLDYLEFETLLLTGDSKC